jgi:hypothetical protein
VTQNCVTATSFYIHSSSLIVNHLTTEHQNLSCCKHSALWGHPHNSTSPSALRNTPAGWLQPLLRCTNSPFLGRQKTALSALTSESHCANQICQLTNDRAGWPANFCIKEGISGRNIHSTLSSSTKHIKTTRRKKLLLTARPRYLVDRALHRPAEPYARLPSSATTSTAAAAIHRGPTTSRHASSLLHNPRP